MQEVIYGLESLSLRRPIVRLLGCVGLLAVILAAFGRYAVVSYAVTERTREIGVRMALGASRGQVLRQITADAIRLTAPGALVGATALLARLAAPVRHIGWSGSGVLLCGVSRTDALTHCAAAAVVACVSFFAAFVPARRTTHVDPVGCLRHE
jgi:putative ABC transport system permease protein